MENMILIILTFLPFPLLPTPEAICSSYLSHFQELMLGNIFFTRRVVEPWNNLPQEVVSAKSEEELKKLIDSN